MMSQTNPPPSNSPAPIPSDTSAPSASQGIRPAVGNDSTSIIVKGIPSTGNTEKDNRELKRRMVHMYSAIKEADWDFIEIKRLGVSRQDTQSRKMNHRYSVAQLTFPDVDMARKVLAGKRDCMRLLKQDQVYITEYLSTEELQKEREWRRARAHDRAQQTRHNFAQPPAPSALQHTNSTHRAWQQTTQPYRNYYAPLQNSPHPYRPDMYADPDGFTPVGNRSHVRYRRY
jgi:hypothetical protein